jgi:hypothetical protein
MVAHVSIAVQHACLHFKRVKDAYGRQLSIGKHVPPMQEQPLTQFERDRLDRIAANNARLHQLTDSPKARVLELLAQSRKPKTYKNCVRPTQSQPLQTRRRAELAARVSKDNSCCQQQNCSDSDSDNDDSMASARKDKNFDDEEVDDEDEDEEGGDADAINSSDGEAEDHNDNNRCERPAKLATAQGRDGMTDFLIACGLEKPVSETYAPRLAANGYKVGGLAAGDDMPIYYDSMHIIYADI